MEHEARARVARAKRIVVKVGTHVLVDKNGRLQRNRIAAIAEELSALRADKKEVVLVSSGSVGAGLQTLGLKTKPTAITDLQMAASIGQIKLLESYHQYFQQSGSIISQVLLTHADLKHRGRHLNARNMLLNLLHHGVIPIVNENDVVSVDDIKIGDNDVLSALVASLIDADLLILLTTPDGLRAPTSHDKTRRVPYIEAFNDSIFDLVTPEKNALSAGGMQTKLQAAHIATKVGAMVVIAKGRQPQVVTDIMRGDDIGTLIALPEDLYKQAKRKRWISYFHRAEGKLIIDQGAADALVTGKKSLLPVGIASVEGVFNAGAQVAICDPTHTIIAYGLVEYNSKQIDTIKGRRSDEIHTLIGTKLRDVVIHRDNLVIT